jgi:hypothetical protein
MVHRVIRESRPMAGTGVVARMEELRGHDWQIRGALSTDTLSE